MKGHRYAFTRVSDNSKTGPIPVTSTDRTSCPPTCPLRGKCYAEDGHQAFVWRRLEKAGLSLIELCARIASLPPGRLWRHDVSGDLAGRRGKINGAALRALAAANTGRRGFTFTHYKPGPHNSPLIAAANEAGFTINLSADNLREADEFHALGIAPVVTLLPANARENLITPAGNKVVVCPAYTRGVQCMDCQLCQRRDRSVIVGFPGHGNFKRFITEVFHRS